MSNKVQGRPHLPLLRGFMPLLPKEQEILRQSPEKFGEALAHKHLQMVNEAVEEWAKKYNEESSTAPTPKSKKSSRRSSAK